MPTTAALAYPATDDDPPMRRAPLALPPGKKEPLLFPSPVQSVHAWRAQDRQDDADGKVDRREDEHDGRDDEQGEDEQPRGRPEPLSVQVHVLYSIRLLH